jgi:hypothetical protein
MEKWRTAERNPCPTARNCRIETTTSTKGSSGSFPKECSMDLVLMAAALVFFAWQTASK